MSFTRRLGRLVAVGATATLILGLSGPAATAADVVGPVTVVTQPATAMAVAVGADLVLTSAATDSADTPVPVEAWQFQPSGGSFSDIPGSGGLATLVVASVSVGDAGEYRAAFPDGSGGRVLSDPSIVTVGDPAQAGAITGPPTVAPGGPIALEVTATGTAPLVIGWEVASSVDGPWVAIAGQSTTSLQTTAVNAALATRYYRATVENAYGSDVSDAYAVATTDWVPLPVPSVTAVSSAPSSLTATWTAGSAGEAAVSYHVVVLLGDVEVATADTTGLTQTFTGLSPNEYRASVATMTPTAQAAPTYSAPVVVSLLAQSGTVSATVLRPYSDGWQDNVQLRATSNYPASGSIRVRNSSSKVVRSFSLAAGMAWSFTFNGKTSSGTRLPFGAYKVEFVLGGKVVATRSITIASSQVSYPTASWSPSTVYPAQDGYYDTSKLSVKTNLPATMSLVIRNSAGSTVYTASLSRRMSGSFTWSGRRSGAPLPAGTYKATITVKGGEGVARSVVKSIAVSAKKVTAVSFSGWISAQSAFDAVVEGEYETGFESGSLALWSSPYLGSTIYTFSASLPSSFQGRYSNLKLYGCGYSYSDAGTALLRLDSDYNSYGGWALGNEEACYGGSFSADLLSGTWMYWAVGNVAENYSYYYLTEFKVTGTRYVLK